MRIAALYFVLFVQFLDASIVSIGLGSIGRDMQVEAVLTQWIVTSYGLGIVVAIPFGVRIMRGVPPAFLLAWGMMLFFIASWCCAVSPSLTMLSAARFAQGFASGCTVLVGQRLLIEFLGEERKTYALTLWTSAVSIAPVVGPVAGALLINLASWRWMFFINLPLIALAAMVLWRNLNWKRGAGRLNLGLTQLCILAAIEITGQLLAAQLMNPEGQRLIDVSDKSLVTALVLSVGAFLTVGQLSGDYVFKWPLLRDVRFSLCTVVLALTNGLLLVSAIVLPFWLQEVRNFPILLVGYVLGVSGLVSGILSPIIGRRLPRAAFAVVGCSSISLIAGSFALAGTWQLGSSFGDIVAPRLLLGLALGLFAVVGPLSIMRFSGTDLNEANALSLFVRIFITNLAVSTFVGGYDRLSRLLSAEAIAGAWAPLGGNAPALNGALKATVLMMVLKVGSLLVAGMFALLCAATAFLFLSQRSSPPVSATAAR